MPKLSPQGETQHFCSDIVATGDAPKHTAEHNKTHENVYPVEPCNDVEPTRLWPTAGAGKKYVLVGKGVPSKDLKERKQDSHDQGKNHGQTCITSRLHLILCPHQGDTREGNQSRTEVEPNRQFYGLPLRFGRECGPRYDIA